ncbi:hypothetical protein AC578_4202 [Pseudocercospora eumusae]|uniref:SnoaL-like domain-containing protein n=1 Tax=Pseudocercospora eumusae TaxID=321146 RepID=A0A139HJ56_9PEZI|nr:hypothetical protein AC578_4202 [Pseudocercospora eumusae]
MGALARSESTTTLREGSHHRHPVMGMHRKRSDMQERPLLVRPNSRPAINNTGLHDAELITQPGRIPVLTPAEATAEKLKAFSCQFIQEVINERNVDSPLFDTLDDDFIGSIKGKFATRRRHDYRKALLQIFRTLPDYHAEVLTCAAGVDERGGVATVWITFKQSGWPGQAIRETTSHVTWRRRRKFGWTGVGYSGMDWGGLVDLSQRCDDGNPS